MKLHSALIPPRGRWWVPAGPQEALWIKVAFVWCILMFAMMPLWHFKGGQNPSGVRGRCTPKDFMARVDRFVKDYQVKLPDGTPLAERGFPVVAPPAGSDIYLQAQMWRWSPVLVLEKGVTYTIHMSSVDLNHGFSLYPTNLNLQIVPGYDYALKMTPNEARDYRIVCNEFCGIGHHTMVGRILVVEPGTDPAQAYQPGGTL